MTPEQKDVFIDLVESLPAADQAALLRFAEFLSSQAGVAPSTSVSGSPEPAAIEVPEPEIIPRPAGEKVVAAVKRLSRSYFMLDKKKMLGATSDLVTQHVIQGRDAGDVIDELERLFSQYYLDLKQGEQGR